MLFSSIPFLYYFLPVVLILYLIIPKKGKNAVLLSASLVFYAWGEKLLVLLFMLSILTGWLIGILMDRTEAPGKRKALLILAVLLSLGMLGYFKYADFFIQNINALIGVEIPLLHVALPIGISFYTFQLLSYDIDVYRRTVPVQKNLISFAAYVSMFPQLIAGPIVRYADVRESLTERTHSLERIASGIRRFVIGLSKKVLIANVLGELVAMYRGSGQLTILYFWMYAVAYALQIYYDFSGYSDMAIGLGRIFGFDFMENFNYPFISASITEFWRRWHISLGSWFRDYVYIPLGGNRKGLKRQLINILIVWMLTGLWHGAAWNFVLWGLLYAVLLTIEKLGFGKWLDRHRGAGHLYVILCTIFGFMVFNASGFGELWHDVSGLVGFLKYPLWGVESGYYLRSYGCVLILGLIGSTPLPKKLLERLRQKPAAAKAMDLLEPVVLALLLLVVTAYLVDGSFNPFLYFRF